MALRIKISNLNPKRRIDKLDVKKVAGRVLKSFKKSNALIDITFLSDAGIRKLNKKYMHKDSATDVLSFSLDNKCSKNEPIGDIYVSSDTAMRNSKRFGTDFSKEIILYSIHGILHLLGFCDIKPIDRIKMNKLQNKFLSKHCKNK